MPIKSITVSLLKSMAESHQISIASATLPALIKGTLVDKTSVITTKSREAGD
jgi:hypothetical protein